MKATSDAPTLPPEGSPPVSARTAQALTRIRRAQPGSRPSTAPDPPLRRVFSFPAGWASTELRWRFRTRTLLLILTVVAVGVGMKSSEARREGQTIAEIQERGGVVVYRADALDIFNATSADTTRADARRRRFASAFGGAWFRKPVAVLFPRGVPVSDADLRLASRLRTVEVIHMADDGANPAVTDRGLARLERMPRLRQLMLGDASVTPAGIERFQQRNPDCLVINDPAEPPAFFKVGVHQQRLAMAWLWR